MAKKKKSTLERVRVALAAVVFSLVTLLFLDFTGTIHHYFGWLARVQLLPALLAANLVAVAVVAALTLLMGRIYCSVICPLGVMQDVVSWAHGRLRRNRFAHSRALTALRCGALAVFAATLVAGFGSIAGLIAPYSAYGRMASNILQPIYIAANNLLAAGAERMGSYAFYSVDLWAKGAATLAVAVATLLLIGVLAWRGGRTWCNTICPVGTVLGLLSRYSWLKIHIDADKCVNCSLCEKNCKASAIDFRAHTVDHSRCVDCGVCISRCAKGAISLSHRSGTAQPKAMDPTRRSFLVGAGLATVGAALAQDKKKVDGGLAVIEDKVAPRRTTPITPPGSLSARNMQQHCTACQLCVAECPNGVLRPSTSLDRMMQPTMSFERGYCRPECNRCSQVCPAGAIRPIDLAVKSATHIGHAVWVKRNCVVLADGVECGNCARHCPAGAIIMTPLKPGDETSPKVPAVNEQRCIGCGACENVCPSRPYSAIYVEGHEQHRID